MSQTVFTFPGKAGDAIMQFPIAYWWAKENNQKITCWVDEKTCKMVVPLFSAQSFVEKVEFKSGIEHWNCGGQPWHFDMPTSDYADRTVYHLGYRSMPQRQLTLEAIDGAKVPLKATREQIAETPCFETTASDKKRRVVLHGQPVYVHTKSTPGFWRFLASIRGDLEARFDEIVFVGSDRDREVGVRTYPNWKEMDDHGDFQVLANYMAASELVIGCGSSPAALGGALKVPTIRVHDQIGEIPKVVFSNLGQNQVNEVERDALKLWPDFKEKWLKEAVPA